MVSQRLDSEDQMEIGLKLYESNVISMGKRQQDEDDIKIHRESLK